MDSKAHVRVFNSMQELLRQLRSRVKLGRRSSDYANVDTLVSSLHYRVTSALLLVCCALVSSRQYFGEPVLCIQDSPDDTAIPSNVLNTYCFITTTYTVIGPSGETWHGQEEEERRHAYYQWVPFVLLMQAMLFAAPHSAWVNWEGGLVRRSLTGVKDILRDPDRDKLRILAHYFAARLHTFHFWASGFYFCQVLNLLNVLGNAYLSDLLLGGNFFHYGLQMSLYGIQTLDSSPSDAMFPKLTKCIFRKYGPSGTIQTHDALCVMSLNIVNDKIFTALWFWFCLLTLVTALSLLWSWVVFLRLTCASSFYSPWTQRVLGAPVSLDPVYISTITRRLDCGDWLFLRLLANNMNVQVYKEFMEHLVQAMEVRKHSEVTPMLTNCT
ncbi:hypothetical protein L9F63_012636 [Diploptera punctata]|uniref:Innexin n=1 Tax=Diploptera punctata TaxID=6984 RepID=A0AAD8AC61_DIPPU|nr:hypothetical protein L9F63_012636 [Diploptera punctata]